MKKNVLLLLNGFGVERAGSYNVYNAELMPNMDRLTKEEIFFSIPCGYLDYKSAYRNFSIGINDPLTYTLVENNLLNRETRNNQTIKYITNELNTYRSKLHIFVYWDSEKTIEQLTYFLKEIKEQTNCKIYLHVVLCHKSINDYKDIARGFTALNYELGNNIKIGVVTGENILHDSLQIKDFIKAYITEYGEKWKDIEKRFQVYIDSKTAPINARTFSVNVGYRLEMNDQILFFNYSNIDINLLMNEIEAQKYMQLDLNNFKFYSLFPVKYDKMQIPFIYNFVVSSNSFLKTLKSLNLKCLVIDQKENCPYINYYLTGLKDTVDPDLKYLPATDDFLYDGEKLLEKINSFDANLYIINFEIKSTNTLEDLRARLKKIDNVIGVFDNYCERNNCGLFITSLYGVEKDVLNEKLMKCNINFSGRAPVVIKDKEIDRKSYSIVDTASLFDLSNTLLWNSNKEYDNSGLLKKKASLFSIFHKKPKKEVK